MVVKRRRRSSLKAVIKVIEASIPDLRVRYGLRSLGVFGSYVTGRQRADSDLDVLVEFEEGRRPGAFDIIGLQDELGEMLRVKVDLGERRLLKPYIGRQVASQVLWLLGGDESGGTFKRDLDMAREYLDFLNDLVVAADQLSRLLAGVSFRDLVRNEEKTLAVTKVVENIGEAAKRVPDEVRARYPEIPWVKMAGTRDRLAHNYWEVDKRVLWTIAAEEVPPLRSALGRMRDIEVQRRENEGDSGAQEIAPQPMSDW